MNGNYNADLHDIYSHPKTMEGDDDYWLQIQLRSAATNKCDHLIVRGNLSKVAIDWATWQKVTVEKGIGGLTTFSGWAETRCKPQQVDSQFSSEYVELRNKQYDVSVANMEKAEREWKAFENA